LRPAWEKKGKAKKGLGMWLKCKTLSSKLCGKLPHTQKEILDPIATLKNWDIFHLSKRGEGDIVL
jgi:hypothetical protein